MENLHYLLMKSHAMLSRKILSEAGKIGLTPGQPKVLDFLIKYGETDQKTIAAYCEIEQATVGSILLRMENAGLVKRRQKDGNRRSLYVSLTELGTEKAEKLMEIFKNAEKEASSCLTEQELNNLDEMLSKICNNMSVQIDKRRCKDE